MSAPKISPSSPAGVMRRLRRQHLPQVPDPRLAALGWRAIVKAGDAPAGDASGDDYKAHRMGFGMPEGGSDYAFGETFPHEALMDHMAGWISPRGAMSARRSSRGCSIAARRARGSFRSRRFRGSLPEPGYRHHRRIEEPQEPSRPSLGSRRALRGCGSIGSRMQLPQGEARAGRKCGYCLDCA